MEYQQRDIVLVEYPFTDLKGSKLRPALIISNRKVNCTGDYQFVMITSQKPKDDNFIVLQENMIEVPFKSNKGLPVTNFLYYKKISTIHKSLIRKKISEVKLKDYDEICELICSNLKKEIIDINIIIK